MKRLEVMDISHGREFKKRRSAGRQPARGQVKDTRADLRDTAQDFDLRRGGDAPTSGEDAGRYRYNQGRNQEIAAGQADGPVADNAGMDWDAGSGGAGYEAATSQTGNTDRAHGFEAGHTHRNLPADGAPANEMSENGTPVHTGTRDFDLRRSRGDSEPKEDFYDISTGKILADMDNEQESSYSGSFAFSEDRSKFAVSHYGGEAPEGCVTVYDFDRGVQRDYQVEDSYVSEVGFCADGGLIAVSNKGFDFRVVAIGDVETGYVEKIDCGSGERLWMQEFTYQAMGMDTAGVVLRCRKYQDETTGAYCDEVLLTVDQSAYTWDAHTGESLAQVNVTGGIRAFLAAKNACYGYLAESNGTVDIADMTKGVNYTTQSIETGKNITDMRIKNGVLVVSAYASPELTVMKYHEGYGKKETASYDNTVEELAYSAGETYYAVRVYGITEPEKVYFYRTEDDFCVGEWTSEDERGYLKTIGFLDDTQFVFVHTRDGITFYDVETGETEQLNIDLDMVSPECHWNGYMALLYDMRQYYVVDLRQRKLLYCGETGGYIRSGVISKDGSRLYCSLDDSGICAVDTSSGNAEVIGTESYQLIQGGEDHSTLVLSSDGRLLAAACVDGNLRVLDVEKRETVATIPFASAYHRFIRFTEDGNSVMLQGDDYYFRVYDLQKQCFSHIAPVQYNAIQRVDIDGESNTISLVTLSNMIILEGESYERMAQPEKGVAYLPGRGVVFCRSYSSLCRFPYMTLDMLLEEERAQFGDAQLTELERTQYNVD